MKKNLWISAICLVLLMFVLNSCGGGKYSDVISLNHQFGKLMEQYANDIDKAGNAKDVAKAMNRFSDSAEKLVPKMKKISEKYPELKDKDSQPKELEESRKQGEAAGKKMGATFMKIMPYQEDPEVMKAQKRMSSVMRGL